MKRLWWRGLAFQRRPDLGGAGCAGAADRCRLGHKDETRPVLGRDRSERLDAKRLGVRAVEGVGEGLLQLGDFGELAVLGEGRVVSHEGGEMAPEPARAPLIGRIGGDIGFHQSGEGLIAEIGVKLLVVLADDLGEPGGVGVAIDAEQHLALFLVAVLNLAKYGVIAGEDAALEAVLDLAKGFHSAASSRLPFSTAPAIARAWLSSLTSSASGGVLSWLCIMFVTGAECAAVLWLKC